MTPAEIYQGGRVVNKLKADRFNHFHEGKLDGKSVTVRGLRKGCTIEPTPGYLSVGCSKTLDGGEIVKSLGQL